MIPYIMKNGVLPPYYNTKNPSNSDPRKLEDQSPYTTTMREIYGHTDLAKNPRRKILIKKLLELRIFLANYGIVDGFQWIDGSFVETKDHPGDIDVITFFSFDNYESCNKFDLMINLNPDLLDHKRIKSLYECDFYYFCLNYEGRLISEITSYWLQLFSHNRNNVWKGLLKVDLDVEGDKQLLNEIENEDSHV